MLSLTLLSSTSKWLRVSHSGFIRRHVSCSNQLTSSIWEQMTTTHRKISPVFLRINSTKSPYREKARIPAWCDRILRKGNNIRQHSYSSASLRFSDHRPVYATFTCSISIINGKQKERLSQDIYHTRRIAVGESTANSRADETDDEDLIGYISVAPGLPPASSESSKWWLKNSSYRFCIYLAQRLTFLRSTCDIETTTANRRHDAKS